MALSIQHPQQHDAAGHGFRNAPAFRKRTPCGKLAVKLSHIGDKRRQGQASATLDLHRQADAVVGCGAASSVDEGVAQQVGVKRGRKHGGVLNWLDSSADPAFC